ncbi:MAG: DegT/DnrJ/EryC1/StrS family aminotransferase [Planctomycetes bacterium]|nr:DegT/DnrJ/EryC1/StrS family aminotransferase [Planctomycetota bacterium]
MEPAIFGGAPLFSSLQHVGGPIVEEEVRVRFHELADEAFARNILTNSGPLSERLEEEVALRHGVRQAVFMTNATLAQMVLLQALGIRSGEAVVAANTFVATPHVCEWMGLRPVFCDSDAATLNMSVADLEKRVTAATRVIIPTHVFGVLADMPALTAFGRQRGIVVLADAAHAFDCDRDGTPPGGYGVPEFLSFHATKYFSTLEGGAVLTNDAALALELRERRNFGFSLPGDAGKLGTNAKGSEISAAFGLASLPALAERRRRLQAVNGEYTAALDSVPGLRIHPVDGWGRNNYRYFALFIDEAFRLERDVLYQALLRENVLCRMYFYPGCQRMSYYRDRAPALPVVENALGRILCLPTSFPHLDALEAAKRLAGRITDLHRRAGEVRDWYRAEGL